jgi:ABC-2 type transport system permease protein
MLYVPIAIYMGKIAGAGVWFGLLGQLLWVLLAYVTARFMWRRGVKKYAAFGG